MSRSIVQHGLRYGLILGLAVAGVAGLVQPQVTAAQSTVNLDLLALEPLTAEEAAEYVYEGILPSLDLLVAPVTVPDAELREEVEEYIAVQEELAALEEEPTATEEPTGEPTVEPTAAPNPTVEPTAAPNPTVEPTATAEPLPTLLTEAEATALVLAVAPDGVVREVEFEDEDDEPDYYKVKLEDGRVFSVDAYSGVVTELPSGPQGAANGQQPITVTPEQAAAAASAALGGATPTNVELRAAEGNAYYAVSFDNGGLVHVDASDGSVKVVRERTGNPNNGGGNNGNGGNRP